MADEPKADDSLAKGMQSILDRLGEFFHIFDLSFFVAGASCFGAFSFLYVMMQKPRVFPFASWVGVAALIIACYICGLTAFAVGRGINGKWFRRQTLERTMSGALSAHNLNDAAISQYSAGNKPIWWRLYIRMWSEVAHDRTAPLVIHHLMRYWAMSATYDAIGFSFLVWASVLLLVQTRLVAPQPISHGLAWATAAVAVAAAVVAFRRGAAYFEYQIEDVVAHFAVSRASLVARSREGTLAG